MTLTAIGSLIVAILTFLAGGIKLWMMYKNDDRSNADIQAGRNDVTAKVNEKSLETKVAMDDVARPSDDAVSDSLRSGKF